MKVMSLNIRGFGSLAQKDNKIGWFKRLRFKESPEIVLIQESKCNIVSDSWIEMIWGSSNFSYIQKPKVGKLGGLLLIWDPRIFVVSEAVEKEHFLAVKGKWNSNIEWVLCGDFNEVWDKDERQNCQFKASQAKLFNKFIDENKLIDVPLIGKRFTTICENGQKFSKLDRFLVNDLFLQSWGDVAVTSLDRNTSDHCPILLKDGNNDFGPKPFKFFD
ncbi:uncharacterized protein [Rutidosis leptorrhynchoides]|uniref:uncharacterized protein n=1 Tax=Rutidosis leptorrhynchoides TaxID=125765 RepID=UPI003A9A16FC